ncbi:McrB family protein [Flavobacterium ardleyense]|uniref:McrB family protein n=1 Tax=Flavobacterium ardleyense TaxID=2038737 RepID=UPI00298C5707|nr:AAA family ATPase [Flavobacterium ardleyense]
MNLPNNVKRRIPIDPKLAVGSSLPKPKELIALTILLYLLNEEKEYLDYSVQSGNTINIKDELIDSMKNFFSSINGYNEQKIDDLRKDNPLVTMQLEPLQVSLQIVWKLAKVKAINSSSSSQERTGRVRVPKSLNFTSNLILLKSTLSDDNNAITELAKKVLYSWLFNESVEVENQNLESKLKTTLLILTEDTLYKTWLNDNTDVLFQQEGIYDLINNSTDAVDLKGAKEIKGTLRNLKSLYSHNLHPYLKVEGDNVSLRDQTSLDEYVNYRIKVANQLDLTPKNIEIVELERENEETNGPQNLENIPHQIIFFGSPGTGKSRTVENITRDKRIVRTTFHPETDYHSFVGSYKPVMDGISIKYEFVPQVFTKAYCNAWLNPKQPYFLIIEEINRGNCAQIFGDLFQCLDRDDNGFSKYDINCDKDLAKYLKAVFESSDNLDAVGEYKAKIQTEDFDKIILPNNLYILATMNTSDQSLFPMDSAFKRRWDWEFVPINYEDANSLKIVVGDSTYNWGNFIKNINPKIKELTGSEDKQLGNRFVNPKDGNITFDQFRSKVLFYLWSEVYKDEYGTQNSIFKFEENGEVKDFQFGDLYNENSTDLVKAFLTYNAIEVV